LLIDRGFDGDRVFLPEFDESFDLHPGTKPLSEGVGEPRLDVSKTAHDWHNDYAEFMLDLTTALESADESQKYQLLRHLKETLGDAVVADR